MNPSATILRAITGCTLADPALAGAVAECLVQNLIRESIHLPEGALHCYWTLELTEAGRTTARAGLTTEH